jgi:hypothetical protein
LPVLLHRPGLLLHRPGLLLHRPGLLLHRPGLPLCGLRFLPMLALAPAWLCLRGSRDCKKEGQQCHLN